jgi:hypothetical protein
MTQQGLRDMRPVLRPASNDSSARSEFAPLDLDFGLPRAAEPAPVLEIPSLLHSTSHLGRCAHCGALNGRSAEACWNCEVALTGTLFEAAPATPPESNASGTDESVPGAVAGYEAGHGALSDLGLEHTDREHAEPAHHRGDEFLPVLDLSAVVDDPLAGHAPPGSYLAVHRPPQSRWRMMAAVGVVAALVCGGGGYLLAAKLAREGESALFMSIGLPLGQGAAHDPDSTTPAMLGATRSSGGATAQGDAALLAADAALLAADAARRAQAHTRTDPAVVADQRPEAADRTKAARPYRKARDATRSATASLATAQPAAEPSRTAAPAPASLGPCTRTVAALGLCASPSNQPRE